VHPECFYIFRSAADRLRGIIIEQAQLLGDAETEACFERAKMRELESAMALQATIIAEQAQLLAELEARSKSRRG